MSQPLAMAGEINGDLLDRFSLVHASSGAMLGLLGVPFLATLLIAVGWEFLERPLKDRFPQVFPNASQDTRANMVGDVGAMMLGWYLAPRVLAGLRQIR